MFYEGRLKSSGPKILLVNLRMLFNMDISSHSPAFCESLKNFWQKASFIQHLKYKWDDLFLKLHLSCITLKSDFSLLTGFTCFLLWYMQIWCCVSYVMEMQNIFTSSGCTINNWISDTHGLFSCLLGTVWAKQCKQCLHSNKEWHLTLFSPPWV